MVRQGKNIINLKLNLGCGLIAPEGWINIDNSLNAWLATKHPVLRRLLGSLKILPKRVVEIQWPKNVFIWDLRKGLPYPDNSVKYIYSSHLLEHLSRAEARNLLKECFRVLLVGGVIRIVVPDLRICIEKYIKALEGWNENPCQLPPAEIFLENLAMYDPSLEDNPFYIKIYKKFYDKNTHKWAYDEYPLANLLKMTGLKKFVKENMEKALSKMSQNWIYLSALKKAFV